MNDALMQVAGSSKYADMFEFRLDLIPQPNIARLLNSTRKPRIVTCRPEWEGGSFMGAERKRIEMLEMASAFGADYVDIELNVNPRTLQEFIRRKKDTKVIVSVHLFDADLFDVTKIYKALVATGADVLKFAFTSRDAADNHLAFRFLSLAKQDAQKAVSIAMEECGEASRALYRKFGGWATYASPEAGAGVLPGQIPARELKDLYRADRLTSSTKIYGVIGHPLGQSKGVYLHNPLFRRAGRNAVYCRFPVTDLDRFMKFVAPFLSGFSVTIPHKQSIIKHLDAIDPTAKAIGAVNTVIRRGGKLCGTNTDATGALDAIERVTKVKGKRVLVIGGGGAARAIAYEAKRRGAEVLIANRTERKAKLLAKEFGVRMVRMAELRWADFDILVNATSVGMFPHVDESPVPKAILKRKTIFDAVYNPPMTRLLREAKRVGARVIQGTEMYLNQAALQSELHTGVKPKAATMRKLISRLK